MSVTFEAPPPDSNPVETLRDSYAAAIEKLSKNFERVLAQIEAHPRYNENTERAKKLVGVLEQAAEQLQDYIDAGDNLADRLADLIVILQMAATTAKQMADETEIRPGSIADMKPGP